MTLPETNIYKMGLSDLEKGFFQVFGLTISASGICGFIIGLSMARRRGCKFCKSKRLTIQHKKIKNKSIHYKKYTMSSVRTVTAVEGYRKPGSTGWDKTWIGLTYDDGNHYMAIFDDGKDFVPDNQTVPVDVYNNEKNSSLNNGWTEEMTPEQIKQVSGVSMGDASSKTNDDCVLY